MQLRSSTPGSMSAPRAVVLDFGGVLTEVHHDDGGFRATAEAVAGVLDRAGAVRRSVDEIEADLRAGSAAYEKWKRAESDHFSPREVSHREFWDRFVTTDWSPAARAVVAAEAASLCRIFEATTVIRPPRRGARELLETLAARGIGRALVCNTLSAVGTRQLMVDYGFDPLVPVQIYSDEAGIRKPNPNLLIWAMTALDVAPADVWYVGDKYDRDVFAARRAGVAAVLMTSGDTDPDQSAGIEPDLVVPDPAALADAVIASVEA